MDMNEEILKMFVEYGYVEVVSYNVAGDPIYELTELFYKEQKELAQWMKEQDSDIMSSLWFKGFIDLMMDNVIECRRRLAGPNPSREIIKIVETNIVCADALKYDYSFKKKRGPGKKKLQNHNKQMKLF